MVRDFSKNYIKRQDKYIKENGITVDYRCRLVTSYRAIQLICDDAKKTLYIFQDDDVEEYPYGAIQDLNVFIDDSEQLSTRLNVGGIIAAEALGLAVPVFTNSVVSVVDEINIYIKREHPKDGFIVLKLLEAPSRHTGKEREFCEGATRTIRRIVNMPDHKDLAAEYISKRSEELIEEEEKDFERRHGMTREEYRKQIREEHLEVWKRVKAKLEANSAKYENNWEYDDTPDKEKPSFCVYCGKPLKEGASFCGYCGKAID